MRDAKDPLQVEILTSLSSMNGVVTPRAQRVTDGGCLFGRTESLSQDQPRDGTLTHIFLVSFRSAEQLPGRF